MSTEMMLSLASPILSFTALFIGLYTWRNNLRVTRLIQHYAIVAQADVKLAETKTCLRFHGIDPETIEKEYGVTTDELSYLLQAFNAGSLSNLLGKDGQKTPFAKGSYWYGILENKDTQKAFPLLQKLFKAENHYIARCDKTIKFINQMDIKKAHVKIE